MALRNAGTAPQEADTTTLPPAGAPAATTPAFEVDDGGVVNEVGAPPAASASTSVAVVAPTKTELIQARPTLDKNTLLRGLQNAIPTEELAPMGIGVFPRITASQGGFVVNKNEGKLGGRIRVEVLSWNYIDMVVTGEQNNAEANKLIRSSYDGVHLRDGGTQIGDGTVKAYVEYLKSKEYDKTNVKRYIELYVNLTAFEQKTGNTMVPTEVPEDEQKIYQVSLSPQSVGQWGKYLLEGSLRKVRGHKDDSIVTLVQEEKTVGANTFAYASFTPKW